MGILSTSPIVVINLPDKIRGFSSTTVWTTLQEMTATDILNSVENKHLLPGYECHRDSITFNQVSAEEMVGLFFLMSIFLKTRIN